MAGGHTESMLFLGRKTPGKANQGGKYSRLQHNLKYSRLYNSRVQIYDPFTLKDSQYTIVYYETHMSQ
jgi:hypothetical protein